MSSFPYSNPLSLPSGYYPTYSFALMPDFASWHTLFGWPKDKETRDEGEGVKRGEMALL